MPEYPHTSVLLKECLAAFEPISLKVFVDATLGAGGHSAALLHAHPELNHLIGIDQDPAALEIAKKRLEANKDCKLDLMKGNFEDFAKHLAKAKVKHVDGILADLGFSSMQVDTPERGFSFMREGPLDMRMDPTAQITAATIINTYPEKELALIFRDLGEETHWRKAAYLIVEERKTKPFNTTTELANFLEKKLGRQQKKGRKFIHPATQIFQALRIAVNRELERLEIFLPAALQSLRPGGRLAIITFHSLEDRIVKRAFAYYASDKESTSGIGGLFLDKKPEALLISRKPLEASLEEISENPRSRSAKLRVIEKL